jgi:hypothetical protein
MDASITNESQVKVIKNNTIRPTEARPESKNDVNEDSQVKTFKLKSLIKETLYNSTAQSIIKIIETPSIPLKVFLLACVIVSSGLCSYLIIELIMSYLSYGVSTTSRTLYETPALFPKITICNANPFTTKYAIEFLKKFNKELYPYIDIFNEEQMNS